MCACVLSCCSPVQLFMTLWTVAHPAPLSMGFSRQDYWNALPCPPPSDLPDPGIKPMSLLSPALSGGFFTDSATWEAIDITLDIPTLRNYSSFNSNLKLITYLVFLFSQYGNPMTEHIVYCTQGLYD